MDRTALLDRFRTGYDERVITSRHFDVPANLAIFGSRARS
jgi:hypothetical protein